MSCYYPRLARRRFKKENGKWDIKFIPARVDYSISSLRLRYGDDLMLIPCGKCLGCQFDKAKDWATRCVLELQYHDEACFVTLTYNDENYPGRLVKSDLQDFIKALRNRGVELRYVACGELGSHTKRAHYHLILFGYCPDDLVFHFMGSDGNSLYTSKTLADIWSKGFVSVGDCSYQSCGYVARYTTKKVGKDDGFLICSTKPGIGYQYYLDHGKDIVKTGYVYGSFGQKIKAPVPRYFEKFLINDFPEEYDALVKARIKKTLHWQDNDLINHKLSNPEELFMNNAQVLNQKISRIDRR